MQKIRKNIDVSIMGGQSTNWAANVDGRDNKGDFPGLNGDLEW